MKSNKVRMNISREMHEWFTAIDGKTNDERMRRVIEINDDYKALLVRSNELERALEESRKVNREWFDKMVLANNKNSALKVVLTMSAAVSAVMAGYISYLQGWFL